MKSENKTSNDRLKKAKIREEKGRRIEERRTLNGQFKPIPKEDAKKIIKAMVDTFPELDLQTPPEQINKAPESAMQEKEPFITQDIEVVQETAPKPDPNFIPRIPRSPNGDPFDNMYKRQRKT